MLNFKEMSLNDLLSLVDNKFYQKVTTQEQFINFIINIYYKACLENGMSTRLSPIIVTELQRTTYAVYNHFQNKMLLNKRPFNYFEECKQQGNLFLPFLMIQTSLHEARHFSQYNCRSKVDEYLKDYAQFALYFPTCVDEISYDTNPLEVDARHYTYSILQKYPYLNKYQSHKAFYKSEYDSASKYASVYTALLKANGLLTKDKAHITPNQMQVFYDMQLSCEKFLNDSKIDIKDFCKSLIQLLIRQEDAERQTRRPTEEKLIERVSSPLKKEMEEKIFKDKILSSDYLLKCKNILLSLNARLPSKELAFYTLKFDTFMALETRAIYKSFAPNFMDFNARAITAPNPPKEEISFMQEYKQNDEQRH